MLSLESCVSLFVLFKTTLHKHCGGNINLILENVAELSSTDFPCFSFRKLLIIDISSMYELPCGGEKRMSTLKIIGVELPWQEKQKSSKLFRRKCLLKAVGVLS